MTDSARTPTHLWIVGGLSLLWNCFGAIDYILTKTSNEAYLAQFTAEQRAFFEGFPLLPSIGWGLGVWGALIGSVLLLLRNRHAVVVFIVSLIGMAISFGYQLSDPATPADFVQFPMVLLTVAIVAIGAGLFLYARAMKARGVLR